ncbi:Cation-ATPase-C domain-containing protein [Aphelenchoides bicaudatus]|nr:Cation-ATPase-C domain-containing protein [Aphelenchoides bicaudatus]
MDKQKWQFRSSLLKEFNSWLQARLKGDKKTTAFMDINGKARADFVHDDTPSSNLDIDFDRLQATQTNAPFVEHALNIEELSNFYPLSRINSEAPERSCGLNNDEAQNSLQEQGPNIIKPKKRRKVDQLKTFFKQFFNKFRVLLLICGFACLIIYLLDPTRTRDLTMAIILIIIFVVLSIVGYVEKSKINSQINGSQQVVPDIECTVIRGSKEIRIQSNSLVRGDLLWIRRSDRVGADVRLIYTKDLKIETSWISGDTDIISYSAETAQKSIGVFEAQNVVFENSRCQSGEGLGLVIRTGNTTLLGQLAQMSNREKRKSRLELEYGNFSKAITLITFCMAITTFIIGLLLSGISNFNAVLINGFLYCLYCEHSRKVELNSTKKYLNLNYSGLPVTLSAQLIFIARRLKKMGLYLKRTDIADTLGLTSVLLMDKSALFASNQIKLTTLWLNRQILKLNKSQLKSEERTANQQTLNDICDVISVCNRITDNFEDPTEHKKKKFRFNSAKKQYQQPAIQTKNSILLDFVEKSGQGIEERCDKFEILFELPFSINRRFHLVVLRKLQSEDEFENAECFAVLKGGPELLIQGCTSIRTGEESSEILDEEMLNEFETHYAKLISEGHSCIGFATMELDSFEDIDYEYYYENLLQSKRWCFLGMAAVVEPPLSNIETAVKKAEQARIRLFLITNDHPSSAEYLARQVGFYNQNSAVSSTSFSSMESLNTSSTSYATSDKSSGSFSLPIVVHGESLDQMTNQDWNAILKHRNVIFAQTTAAQKLQLINQCHRLNYVVALTGSNEPVDAKSLKEADIGIATRLNGSIFAKEAADIVALQPDLPCIIDGIAQTRLLFDNFRKTLAYALSHLMPELLPVLLSFIFGFPLGLNSVQVLTIDLITEIPPSIALIFEPAERDIMKRPPRSLSSRLVTPALLGYSYCIAGSLISVGCFISYLSVFWYYDLSTSDLLFTANNHWTQNSSILTGSLIKKEFDATTQWEIYEKACAAWHICLVFSQIFNLLCCTTRRTSLFKHGIKNPVLIAAVIIKVVLMFLIIFVPLLQSIVGVQPPPFFIWLIPFAVGGVLLFVNEIRKFFIRKRPRNRFVRMVCW